MKKYEVNYEPHSGVYSILVKDEIILNFAPKAAEDLSGWSLNKDGWDIAASEPWEDATHEEIVNSLKEMETELETIVGPENAKEITALVIVTISE